MSGNNIEFVNTDDIVIKHELGATVKHEILDDVFPRDVNELFEKASKCGDIFVFEDGKFTFCCYFCSERFVIYEDFTNHIREGHSILFKPNVDLSTHGESELPAGTDKDDHQISEFRNLMVDPECILENQSNESLSPDLPLKAKKARRSKYQCDQCDKKCRNDYALSRHKNKFHAPPEQIDDRTCKFCSRVFGNLRRRKIHEKIHTEEKNVHCPVCSKAFRKNYQMKKHLVIHSADKPYKCEYCPSSFAEKRDYERHKRRTHLGERSYKCDYCDKTFFATTERTSHMRIHTGERPFQCEQCGQSFRAANVLTAHKIRHHLKLKKFECQMCDKKFVTSSCLTQHMATHSNEKTISCSICSATFSIKRALRHHMKLHSDVKEYACKICGKEFKQSPGLYSHMKTHGITSQKRAKDTDDV